MHGCLTGGGGGGVKGDFDAMSELFWPVLDFLPKVGMHFVEKLVPSYFGCEEVKNQDPMAK